MKADAGKKKVVLELGGNAACIVEDFRSKEELDAIIPKLIHGAYYQSGQSCISVQRLFVRQVPSSPCRRGDTCRPISNPNSCIVMLTFCVHPAVWCLSYVSVSISLCNLHEPYWRISAQGIVV